MRCRDAIEELHHEIEEERRAKDHLQKELLEMGRALSETNVRAKQFSLETEALREENVVLKEQLNEIPALQQGRN